MTLLTPMPHSPSPSPHWKNTPPPVEVSKCQTPFVEPRPGQICLACGEGVLAFDGRMELSCPRCGEVAGGGGFT